MKKTKIDWADSTWNPVTGCLHGCEYCYARGIANRFAGCDKLSTYMPNCQATWRRVNPDSKPEDAIFEVDAQCPPINIFFDAKMQKVIRRTAPYPWGFQPTLRRDKLSEPSNWKKPRTIFVCSMADLFGEWVPDDWIKQVFEACEAAPQHRYLFLTKNSARYIELAEKDILPDGADNMWFGSTATTPEMEFFFSGGHNTFLSIEPILKPFHDSLDAGVQACEKTDWIIVGAETGNRKDKVIPKADWIMEIVQSAEKTNTPVFMKESLRGIMGDCFRQEFPWEASGDD